MVTILGFVIFFVLLLGGLAGLYAALLFFGSGLLWAPFAAWLSYREADRQGLAPRRYAVLGGVYSILCIFLWLNLMAGMRKDKWNQYKTGLLYIALFLIWFGLILMALLQIGSAYLQEYLGPPSPRLPEEYYRYRPVSPWTHATMVICGFMVVAWLVSAIKFWDSRTSILANDGPFIPLGGLLPFGLALLSTVVTIVYVTGYDATDGVLPWTRFARP